MAHSQQNCVCTEYQKLKSDSKNAKKDIADRLMSARDNVCKAKGYELMGEILESESKLDSALTSTLMSENLIKKSGCHDSLLLNIYKIIAGVYYAKADFVNAQNYSLKMIDCAEKSKNVYEQALGYTMTAQLFNQTNQADIGIKYTRKATKLLPKLEGKNKYSIIFFLSSRYLWHYQDTKTKSSLDTVEIFSRQYLARYKELQDSARICNAYNLLQGVCYEKGEYSKALIILDSSFTYIDKQDNESKQLYYFDRADIMLELKDFTGAQISADSALHYALINNNPAYTANVYELLEGIAFAGNDFKQAYEMNKLKSIINDSIRNVEKIEAVAELEKKYNQIKNENTIKDLDKKNQIFLLLLLAGLFGLLALAFFLRQQKLKHRQDILETEQRLNRARMNPHFFFNALATLQKFALRDNDGQTLASNLSKFSHIMRETLESTYKEYITVEQETDFLNEYLEVQKIRFPNTFSYAIHTNEDMEVDDILIPSMILQPFIENSIEHGFTGITYPGHVDIYFKIDKKELLIEVSDNGKGLNTKLKENNDHISRAGQIIRDRIYLLNIKLKTKAGFSIDNNKDGAGTIVKIHLPLLYQSNQNAGL
jgi:anti-sigma regulatory factor (Ser/Thr protein kinase)